MVEVTNNHMWMLQVAEKTLIPLLRAKKASGVIGYQPEYTLTIPDREEWTLRGTRWCPSRMNQNFRRRKTPESRSICSKGGHKSQLRTG